MNAAKLKARIEELSKQVQSIATEIDGFMAEKSDKWKAGEVGNKFTTATDCLSNAETSLDDAAAALE